MNTETMNNVEKVTEITAEAMDNVTKSAGDFGKGVAVGAGAGLLLAGGIKLVITAVKKHKRKKYIEAQVTEVPDDDIYEDDDSVL